MNPLLVLRLGRFIVADLLAHLNRRGTVVRFQPKPRRKRVRLVLKVHKKVSQVYCLVYKLLDHASEATGSHCGSNDVEGISHHALFSRKTTRFQDLCISLLSRQLKCWDYNRQSRNSSALFGKALHIIQLHLLQIHSNSSFHVFSGVWEWGVYRYTPQKSKTCIL